MRKSDTDTADRELVSRCLAGRQEAFEQLIQRYAPYLARVIHSALVRRKGLGGGEWTKDLLQDTFLDLFADDCAKLREFRWECPLQRYLSVFAIRNVQHHSRRETHRSAASNDRLMALLTEADLNSSEIDRAGNREILSRVERGLDSLAPRERLAIKLTYWDELPAAASSKVLDLEPNAFYVLLHRARKKLASIIRNGTYCL